MIVKVYSTPACPYCSALKEYLKSKDIQFEDIDISADDKAREEMVEKAQVMSVPVMIINEESMTKVVVGFDLKKVNDALHICSQ